jgi:cell division protein FtsN
MRNLQNLKRQQGGTILGIIIGLVIGLGIALAVAMTINKTPMPFVDKVSRQNKADSSPAQISDLNKPLYGNKAAAKAAAKEFVKEPAEVVQVTATAQPADAKATDATVKEAAAKSDDKWNYYLQAGAFRDQSEAEALRGKLALMGVEARVSERPSENGVLYRVRVGPYGQIDAMNKVRGKLTDNGVDAAVVRIVKN